MVAIPVVKVVRVPPVVLVHEAAAPFSRERVVLECFDSHPPEPHRRRESQDYVQLEEVGPSLVGDHRGRRQRRCRLRVVTPAVLDGQGSTASDHAAVGRLGPRGGLGENYRLQERRRRIVDARVLQIELRLNHDGVAHLSSL